MTFHLPPGSGIISFLEDDFSGKHTVQTFGGNLLRKRDVGPPLGIYLFRRCCFFVVFQMMTFPIFGSQFSVIL